MKKFIMLFLIITMGFIVSACGIKGPPKPPPDPESSFLSKKQSTVKL